LKHEDQLLDFHWLVRYLDFIGFEIDAFWWHSNLQNIAFFEIDGAIVFGILLALLRLLKSLDQIWIRRFAIDQLLFNLFPQIKSSIVII